MPATDPITAPPEPLGDDLLSHWMLDPSIAFLNHGSFGSCPRVVLDAQTEWRERIETHPIELLDRRRNDLLAEAKAPLAAFLGADPADFGFVTNATGGVNAVLRSLQFGPGDEILTTTCAYNAVRLTLRYVCERSGATLVEALVPLPLPGPNAVLESIEDAITPRTKLVVVDHVTSETALMLPLKAIVALCRELGVDVLVDGAHAPGMVELDLDDLGAAYYTGNLHKWVCAPKGTAVLWVRRDRQAGIHPLTISHFVAEDLARQLSWQATRDISGWLSTPRALRFLEELGWDRVRAHNHRLACWAQAMLAGKWGTDAAAPPGGSMLGSMATVALPDGVRRHETPAALQAILYERHRIEVPVLEIADRWWTRVSCQIYNVPDQYVRLAGAVSELAGD